MMPGVSNMSYNEAQNTIKKCKKMLEDTNRQLRALEQTSLVPARQQKRNLMPKRSGPTKQVGRAFQKICF